MLNWRRDITALRGIAVLFVVWYHAGWPGASSGYLGVDAFFVISGYLITSMLVRELESTERINLTQFWARRIKRLIPASATVLVAVLISSRWTLEPLRAVQTGRDAVSASTFWANIHFWLKDGDYFKAGLFESPLRHYWSLSLEEQYYLVLPVLVLLAWRTWRERGVATLLFFSTAASFIYSLTTDANSSFYLLQSRAWQLGAGGVLAVAHHRLRSRKEAGFSTGASERARVRQRISWWVALAGLVAAMSVGLESKAAERVVVVLFATIMLHMGSNIETITFLRPLEWLGNISYSFYLWHWPLLIMSGRASRRAGDSLLGSVMDTQIPAISLSVLLAYLTYRYIENLRWSNILSVKRRTYIIGLSCVMTTLSLAYITQTQAVRSDSLENAATTSSPVTHVATTTVFKEAETEIAEGMVMLLDGTIEIRDPVLAADQGAVKPPAPEPYLPMSECGNDWPNQSECQTWGGGGTAVLMAGEIEGWQWPFHYLGQKYGFKAVTIRGCENPDGPVWGQWCDRWLKERWTPDTPLLVSLSEKKNLESWINKLGGETEKVAFISPVSSKESETCLREASKYAECNRSPEDNTIDVDGIIYHDTNDWLCGDYCPGSIDNHPVSKGRTVSAYTAIKLTDRIRSVVESVARETVEVRAWDAPAAPANITEELERAVGSQTLNQGIADRLDDVRNSYPEINACRVGLADGDSCLDVLDPEKPVVLVVGDSHAGQWAEVIDREVVSAGGQTLVVVGCKAMLQTEDTYNGTPECRGFEDRLDKFVKTRKPVLIVASSKVGERGTLLYRVRGGVYGWVNRQKVFWERIAPGSGGVLIIADNPLPKDDVPLCLSDNQSNTRTCGDTRAASETFYLKNAENKMASELKNKTGVPFRYIDPVNWICTQTWCPANTENSVIYRDNNHLSAEYVERIRYSVTEAVMSMYGAKQ